MSILDMSDEEFYEFVKGYTEVYKENMGNLKQKEDNKILCDYCGKEMDFKDIYWRKIGDKLYYGHKHCMMNMIKEEE